MQKQLGNNSKLRGQAAEHAACLFLQRQGLQLVCKNYRCRRGEIDLVMRDHELLVFVEVRMRNHSGYGGAAASVTRAKQRRLVCTAAEYLQAHKQQRACRFDVVEVVQLGAQHDADGHSNGAVRSQAHCVSNWIRNAFSSCEEIF
ncbi:MAG: YraN family protein [Pseudomonadales bacterium]|nr:MAG: YraN family protein [Pseudomonadales bacterium]